MKQELNMPENPVTRDRRRPVLGWVSVGLAVSIFALIVGSFIGLGVLINRMAATSGGIGGLSGGVSEWVFYVYVAIVAAGVISAVVGLKRGEHRRWVHTVGLVLNLGSLPLAVAALFLMVGW